MAKRVVFNKTDCWRECSKTFENNMSVHMCALKQGDVPGNDPLEGFGKQTHGIPLDPRPDFGRVRRVGGSDV